MHQKPEELHAMHDATDLMNWSCSLVAGDEAAACCGSRVLLHTACRTPRGREAAAKMLGGLDFAQSPMANLRAFKHIDGKKCKRSPSAGHSARARMRHDLSDWLKRRQGAPSGYGINDPLSQRKWYPTWRGCFGCNEGSCCTGRGDCVLGVCTCRPGACGIDCGQPCNAKDPAQGGASQPKRGMAIYVYDLPVDLGLVQFAHRVWARNLRNGEMIYGAEWRFLELLLSDGATRAERPEDADLFYIPMLGALGPGGSIGGGCERDKLELIVRYVRARWPWWDRSGGRDHVLFMTGDQGACGLGSALARPIVVSHWGMLGTMKRLTAYDKEQTDWVDSSEAQRGMSTGRWCHGPHKDVVVPPFSGATAARAAATPSGVTLRANLSTTCTWFDKKKNACRWRGRPALLHAGGVWGWHNTGVKGKVSFYSQGMRQQLFMQYAGDAGRQSGILVSDRSVPDRLWTQADFCFAPSGSGWGMRTTKILSTLDCLPMISQPYVVQPLETVLPLHSMSARVEFAQVKDLPRLLEKLTAAPNFEAMRARAGRVRKAFSWGAGGLAYNYTVLALCHRATELRGALKAGGGADCAHLAAALPEALPAARMPDWFSDPVVKAVHALQASRRQLVAAAAAPGASGGEAQIDYGP